MRPVSDNVSFCAFQLGSNPTKVMRGDRSYVLERFVSFELQDGDTIVFPKDHCFQVMIEREAEEMIGR